MFKVVLAFRLWLYPCSVLSWQRQDAKTPASRRAAPRLVVCEPQRNGGAFLLSARARAEPTGRPLQRPIEPVSAVLSAGEKARPRVSECRRHCRTSRLIGSSSIPG
jgi:hypothetical protein